MALTDNLISVWHMNNDWQDSWGANHITPNGATFDDVVKKLGSHAGNFDAVDDKATVSNESAFDFERTSPFSVSCWVRFGSSLIVYKGGSPFSRGWRFQLAGDSYLYFDLYSSGTNSISLRNTTTLSTGIWYHVVVTYNGNSLASGVNFYVDNVIQSKVVNANNLTGTTLNNNSLLVSASVDVSYAKKLDELAIWNKELTSTEVAELWNGGAGMELGATGVVIPIFMNQYRQRRN